MEKKTLISFIVPYHDEPAWMLTECLGSIGCMDFRNDCYEIIVVDDGSRVSPAPLLQTLNLPVRYIRQDNQGLSAARNTGIDAAQGEYIQFVDSDDTLTTAYNHCVRLMQEGRHDVIKFEFTRKQTYREWKRNVFEGDGITYLTRHTLKGAAWSYAFRTSLLQGLRFEVGIYHEDELFTPLLLLKAKHMVLGDGEAYYYRIRENSITTANNMDSVLKRLKDTLYIIKSFRAISQEYLDNGHTAEAQAISRRYDQLSLAYAYNILTQLPFRQALRTIRHARKEGILPLRIKPYSRAYFLLSILSKVLQ